MGYPYEIYRLAEAELSKRKNRAENTAEENIKGFGAEEPQYLALRKTMSQTAVKTARIILSSDDSSIERLQTLRKENLFLQQQIAQLLAAHGHPADYLEPHYCCDRCRDTGYVDGFMCDCLKQLARNIACDRLNRLTPLELSGFESLKADYYSDQAGIGGISPRKRMENIINFCIEYAKNFAPGSPSLLFMGATGLGKTHISLAIAREVTEKGFGVVYGSVQGFMTKLEQEYFGRDGSAADCRNMLVDCDLLILDDLGSEFSTNFTVASLYDIINSRIAASKATVINTNLSLSEIEARYTERVVSRICGCYKTFKFDGQDIRTMRL